MLMKRDHLVECIPPLLLLCCSLIFPSPSQFPIDPFGPVTTVGKLKRVHFVPPPCRRLFHAETCRAIHVNNKWGKSTTCSNAIQKTQTPICPNASGIERLEE
ncbi:hypothetical protein HDK77DRAFT_193204 [Phyllosticta capitalensis]|uniref:Secreted protein n=1 Tax=Phyllosticta capitalensis TaxID=121624 RepID=A0ABR1YW87_9PEZI